MVIGNICCEQMCSLICNARSHVSVPLLLDIWNMSQLKCETFYELKNLEILQAEDYIYDITFNISIISLYFKHLLSSYKKSLWDQSWCVS